jgi:hypothetical protein
VPGRGVRPCPDFASYTLAFALQLRKNHRKTCQGTVIRLVDSALAGEGLDWLAGPCCPWLSRQATGSTLGQRKYLPNCRTRGFLTLANFESKLAVIAPIWSANSGTPRSSCICLLLTYQGSPVVGRRHLDFNTCSLQRWVRAADLQAGHA